MKNLVRKKYKMNLENFKNYINLYQSGIKNYKNLSDEVLKSDSKHS